MAELTVHELLTGNVARTPVPTTKVGQHVAFLNANCSEELVFLRLLLGTVTIEHIPSAFKWDQRRNFTVLGMPTTTFVSRQSFLRDLSAKGISVATINNHLRGNLRQSAYYNDLCGELLQALFRMQKSEHTVAFIHIYRLLERISFAFPLVYAAKSKDFKNAYMSLKEFIEGGTDKGELAFFRKFVETSIDPVLVGGNSVIDVDWMPANYKAPCYDAIKKFVSTADIVSDSLNQNIEIKNRSILSLLINLRNRYFHFSSNHTSNLSSVDVPNADYLFASVNELFLNWLSAIYFEILRHVLKI